MFGKLALGAATAVLAVTTVAVVAQPSHASTTARGQHLILFRYCNTHLMYDGTGSERYSSAREARRVYNAESTFLSGHHGFVRQITLGTGDTRLAQRTFSCR